MRLASAFRVCLVCRGLGPDCDGGCGGDAVLLRVVQRAAAMMLCCVALPLHIQYAGLKLFIWGVEEHLP